MAVVLGWDIGGANIKTSLVEVREGRVTRLEVRREYFPLWKRGREALPGGAHEKGKPFPFPPGPPRRGTPRGSRA